MKRGSPVTKKATAILTADIHVTHRTPTCRIDDYVETMKTKLQWLERLRKKHDCVILDAGDILDRWKSSPELMLWMLDNLPNEIITIPGNHDLPQHNINLLHRSGLGLLERVGKIRLLTGNNSFHLEENGVKFSVYGLPWKGVELGALPPVAKENQRRVLLIHELTWTGGKPWGGCDAPNATKLLKRHPDFDLIVSGHNHRSFIHHDKDGRTLVNPGSLMRRTADQLLHRPKVYLWYGSTGKVTPINVPTSLPEEVMSREHIDRIDQKNERIAAFVERLNKDWVAEFSFEKNLEKFFSHNQIPPKVEEIVWESVEKTK